MSGLTDGVHNFAVFAKGPYPWSSTGNASFTVATSPVCGAGKPALSLAAPVAFWFDYPAYVARNLSITWTVNNTGTTTASSVALTGSTSANPAVTTLTGMPATVGTGTIAPSSSGSVTVQYHVPDYVGSFRVINTASATDCAANLYTYP